MSKLEVIDTLCSEWDDSSQTDISRNMSSDTKMEETPNHVNFSERRLKNSTTSSQNSESKIKNLPSVYSKNQIARHNKRINELRALEQDETESDSDDETNHDADMDRDLDINLRIFEESVKSVENVVIGEIQCNILHESTPADKICDANESDDPMVYSDNDSDMEILVSKPIVRKRTIQSMKKEKPAEGKQKLTMYDLIHDNVLLSPKKSEDEDDLDLKEESKTTEVQKIKPVLKKSKLRKEDQPEISKEAERKEEKNQNLPVPKLKVGADGEVVIDMDSLVIEQTGVSEARSALANSDVVEECGLSYTSYSKKCSFRKQWTPHETLKFYQVLSTIGTDFTLMATLFPGRTRKCMKRKFKREEKNSPELIMKALSCKQNFNMNLLEKELQLKDEKLNLFKENNKKQKVGKKKKDPPSEKKGTKTKRKSFFESSVSSFREK